MSDTLLLTKGGSLLIEFPDKPGINLTPVKSEYSPRASSWQAGALSRAHAYGQTLLNPNHFEWSQLKYGIAKSIYTHIGGVHPQLSRADKEYYLSLRLTPPRWIFGYFLLRANKANAWSQQSRLNYLPTLEVYCLGNLSSKWQNESTLHRFLSARCDVIHSWRVDLKSVDATLSPKQPAFIYFSWDEDYTCVICKQQLFWDD